MTHYTQKKAETLSASLRQNLALSGSAAKKLLDTKNVFVNNKRVWIARYQLRVGDKVETPEISATQEQPDKKIKIVYEDEFLLVADKPAGINTNEKNSLELVLKKQLDCRTLQAIHRLDKETSGLVLFAKSQECFEKFKIIFKEQTVKKIYFALAAGNIKENNFVATSPVDNKPATSKFVVLQKNQLATFLKVDLLTGRKHQIRVHLKERGHPLIGDTTYFNKVEQPLFKQFTRQLLHASELKIKHPYTQKELFLTTPLPADFRKALKLLKLVS